MAADGEPTRGPACPVSGDIFTGVVFGDRHVYHGGAGAARAYRARRIRRYGAGRFHGRRARQPGPELPGVRQGAGADRQFPSQHCALPGVSGRRRLHHHRDRQRQPVSEAVRRAGRARARQGPGLYRQQGAAGAARRHRRQADGPDREIPERRPAGEAGRRRRAGRPDQHARSGVRRPARDPSRHEARPGERCRQGRHHPGRAHADHARRQADGVAACGNAAPRPSIRRRSCARSARRKLAGPLSAGDRACTKPAERSGRAGTRCRDRRRT